MSSLESTMRNHAEVVDRFISDYFASLDDSQPEEISYLLKSMSYSSNNGGKRFRPVLSMLAAEMLGVEKESVLPFATAVELIHTYSLIHDDLPCMDDDDERRGEPTNHKVFGEDIALIAGDGLLTEAFFILSDKYRDNPEIARSLSLELSKAAGFRGMVGGQAIDLKAQKDGIAENKLLTLHRLKTGALIEVSARGAGIVANSSPEDLAAITEFGALLGLSFQVADDILDYDESNPEKGNFVTVNGMAETKSFLQESSDRAISLLQRWPDRSNQLIDLVNFNHRRGH